VEQLKTPNSFRLELIDALRGFAVMAILLVHNQEHFIYPVYPDPATQPNWLNVLDKRVFELTFGMFAGKSYSIFALLFGFTFHIQYSNQQRQGKDFGYRFLWRLLLLTGFATINASIFPGGDVLLLYAVVGVSLFIVRKWSDKAILITAIILLCQPIEWYHYVSGLLDPAYTLPDLGVNRLYMEVINNTKEGDLGKFIIGNITSGQAASFLWAVGTGRFLQTAGLFMIGLLLGRKLLFVSTEDNIRFWVKVLIASAIIFNPLYVLKVQVFDNGSSDIIKQTAGVVFDMWQKLAFTFVLVSSFVLLYQTDVFKRLTSNLRFYGRMSLTNYITQSFVGALIYFPFGLHLAPKLGYAPSFLVGVAMFFLQVAFCKWWLKHHKQGPFESLWHKLTWMNKGGSNN
jgi:uncharacterized protein